MKLVTGGGGYIGSYLVRHLMEKGDEVRVFDIQKTKYMPDDVEFVQGDMRDYAACVKAVDGCESVFHLAFVQVFSRIPEKERQEINIGGTENFMKAALEAGVKKFVHTSTIEIYGNHPPNPCTEEAPIDEPCGWYGRHKVECEEVAHRYLDKGLAIGMLRMPAVCGTGHYCHTPMLQMLDRIVDGKWLPIPGDGSILGHAVHYEDVVVAYAKVEEREESVGEAFNIAGSKAATHREIFEAMKERVNSKTKLVSVPVGMVVPMCVLLNFLRVMDCPEHQYNYVVNDVVFSIEKARKLLDWEPKYDTAQSFAELIGGYAADREYIKQRNVEH